MTAVELLTTCRQAGIHLEAAGDTLRYEAPRGALTSELRDTLAQRKAEILAVLRPAEFVTLRNGPTLPLPVLQLAWGLEDRGFTLSLTPGGTLTVAPTNALSDADRIAIRRWRQHLTALTDYVERTVEEPV